MQSLTRTLLSQAITMSPMMKRTKCSRTLPRGCRQYRDTTPAGDDHRVDRMCDEYLMRRIQDPVFRFRMS